MEPKFKGAVKSEEEISEEKCKFFKGVNYRETRQVKNLVGIDNETWTRITIIRRIGDEGMMSKVIDIFENSKNVWHEETSTLADENELEQFNRTWIQAWK